MKIDWIAPLRGKSQYFKVMAKELPYFKFEPNQWENGNIQICSREAKGLFIDLCCMYWSRLGNLPYKLAVQKLCGGNAVALDSLSEDNIIKIEDGFIRIDFLEEQLNEFKLTAETNSKNAKDGWEKRRQALETLKKDATALPPQSDPNAIREEKKKEDKIKENNIDSRKLKFASTLQPFLLTYGKDFLNDFYKYWTEPNKSNTKFKQELEKTWSLERRLETWAKNDKNFQRKVAPKETKAEERSRTNMDIIKSNMEILKQRENGTIAIIE